MFVHDFLIAMAIAGTAFMVLIIITGIARMIMIHRMIPPIPATENRPLLPIVPIVPIIERIPERA